MISTITCQFCGKTVPLNPRLKKKHKYCSAKECQQARRSARKKVRYKNDTAYRKKQLESQQTWRQQRPSHQYQREYRESHPEYVLHNRELQHVRNKKRQSDPSRMIVNGTSLFPQPSNGAMYAIFKVKDEKIVNGTSFIAGMHIISGKEMFLGQNSI
jgi:hypothetical protein